MSTRTIDVFNGDADGLCALHQLRLSNPVESELVTGPKRDISLLKPVAAGAGDRKTGDTLSLTTVFEHSLEGPAESWLSPLSVRTVRWEG